MAVGLDDLAGRCVAIELQWVLVDDDWMLDLHAIVDAPGPDHSAYKAQALDRFAATTVLDREHAHASAEHIAHDLGVPLEAPDLGTLGGKTGSRWIERAAPGPLYGYPLRWTAFGWTDDGEQRETTGRDTMYATSGQAAAEQLADDLVTRLEGGALRVFVEGDDDAHARRDSPPPYPSAAHSRDAVRTLAMTSPPSTIAKALDPSLTAFELIVVFSECFHWWHEELVALAAWHVDRDDSALDAALAPKVEQTRPTWDRPRRIREAFAAGRSVAALLRAEGLFDRIRLFIQMREVFDITLGGVKEFLDRVQDPANDAMLDASLRLR